jgi:hypothetical protein
MGVALAMAATAYAAPNVTNNTQKGSLLIFPDIDVRDGVTTIVRLANDGSLGVDVKCIWMDGNKNRTDFIITLTKNQAIWFDAKTGEGTYKVNKFPAVNAGGFDNPFLPGGAGAYGAGLLVCFAVDEGAMNQIKWNHIVGTATVMNPGAGWAYEYTAYAFFVPTGLDQDPVGVAGTLNLNGVEYDSCPLYQLGEFHPAGAVIAGATITRNRLAIAGCTLNLNQDWIPVWTKLQFDVWNSDEIKFTGAYECSDSWHETTFLDIDAGSENFYGPNLGTAVARYRVQGVKSTQCEGSGRVTQAVGVVGIHSTFLDAAATGTNLSAAGKFTGRIVWDPEGAVPEGVRR